MNVDQEYLGSFREWLMLFNWPWRTTTYAMMNHGVPVFAEHVPERLDDSTTYPPIQIRRPM